MNKCAVKKGMAPLALGEAVFAASAPLLIKVQLDLNKI